MSERIQTISPADLSLIKRELSGIAALAVKMSSDIVVLDKHQLLLENKIESTETKLEGLITEFLNFVRNDMMHKELQLAETRILKVRQEREQKFGSNQKIRRLATGLLQAVDLGVVETNTIKTVTEELMLESPAYWLAPTLIAVSAWIRNDKGIAEKALFEALKRDDYKTSMFLTLLMNRLRRVEATHTWLDRFFLHQNPEKLSREFIIIFDAIAIGTFPVGAVKTVCDHLDRWLSGFDNHQDIESKQIGRWSGEFDNLIPAINQTEFQRLRTFATNWDEIEKNISRHRANLVHDKYFSDIFKSNSRVTSDFTAELDKLLQKLASDFEDNELYLAREERLLELIIENGGDKPIAAKLFQQETDVFLEEVHLADLITNASMRPEQSKASIAARKLVTAYSKKWIIGAHDDFVAKTRIQTPKDISLGIDGWNGTTSDGSNENQLLGSMNQYYQDWEQRELAKQKISWQAWLSLVISVPFLIQMNMSGTIFGLLFLAMFAVGVYRVSQRKKLLKSQFESRSQNFVNELRATLAEVVDFRSEAKKHDRDAEEFRDEFLKNCPENFQASSTPRKMAA